MVIEKSTGVTPTEQLLADLCDRTFLKLWSYPNPYKADGKELCDLIAVFDNHIFLFFDRESRKFENSTEDINVQWNRWYKNAIERQLKTSHGAKRYVLENPNAVFMDNKATIAFPIPIPTSNVVVHNIIVAHGAAEACKRFSPESTSGSLAIAYSDKVNQAQNRPFFLILSRDEPIHIFDTSNLEIILSELDTVYDFTAYLMAKEKAIKKYENLIYCGEEDLLANYFYHFDEEKQEYFIGVEDKSVNAIMVGEGAWESFIEKSEYKKRKEANIISTFWDNLLQHTSQNALNGVVGGNGNVFNGQSAIYEMAKEPRFSRRTLSNLMINSIKNFPEGGQGFMRNLLILPSFYKNRTYVFLQLHHPNIEDYDNEYRKKRQALLELACGVTKNKFPNLEQVIGIAIDAPKFTKRNSEDFILLNCKEWSNEDKNYYSELNKSIHFLESEKLKMNIITSRDFPTETSYKKGYKVARNSLCPCGSVKKYKRCCGINQ